MIIKLIRSYCNGKKISKMTRMITRSMARNFPKKRLHDEPYPVTRTQKKEIENNSHAAFVKATDHFLQFIMVVFICTIVTLIGFIMLLDNATL
jgi:hypothetical protein